MLDVLQRIIFETTRVRRSRHICGIPHLVQLHHVSIAPAHGMTRKYAYMRTIYHHIG